MSEEMRLLYKCYELLWKLRGTMSYTSPFGRDVNILTNEVDKFFRGLKAGDNGRTGSTSGNIGEAGNGITESKKRS